MNTDLLAILTAILMLRTKTSMAAAALDAIELLEFPEKEAKTIQKAAT